MHVRSRILASICLLSTLVLAASAVAQSVIDTMLVGVGPVAVAVNPKINKIYVVNEYDPSVSVINGADDSMATVTTGLYPAALALNSITNEMYVVNEGDDNVTVIDANNNTWTIPVGSYPTNVVFDSTRNLIYVANTSDYTVSVINGWSNLVIKTITVRTEPGPMAVNPVTGKVYVANQGENTISVIDGNNLNLAPVSILVGHGPSSVVVNPLSNKIYVVNESDDPGTVSVIDGATNHVTATLTVGNQPWMAALNPATNQIYVAVHYDTSVAVIDGFTNTISYVSLPDFPDTMVVDRVTNKIYVAIAGNQIVMIDGTTRGVVPVTVGWDPDALAVNESTNRIYVANYNDNTVSVIAGANPNPAQFVAVTPCRLIDTRQNGGAIAGGTSRSFPIPQLGGCNIPASAAAYSLNVTGIPSTGYLGFLSLWPTGLDQPLVSTLNSLDGRIKADAAIVASGYQGGITVYVTNTANVILDINGYFAPVSGSTLAFYPLTPCRVADTRSSAYPPGLGQPHLTGMVERDFPMLSSSCIPAGINPQAYSLNFTAVPYPTMGRTLGYLEVWPTDQKPQNPVSTLNNLTGTIVANAAIVPAGTNGAITALGKDDTDLIIDINGYFAPASEGGLSLYAGAPCRVLDTRYIGNRQPFVGNLSPPVDVVNSVCGAPANAQAFVFNATVVPKVTLGYLTLWPDGGPKPVVSTLNAMDGWIANNMAIVPTANGKVDAFANDLTHLILDISGYFAP